MKSAVRPAVFSCVVLLMAGSFAETISSGSGSVSTLETSDFKPAAVKAQTLGAWADAFYPGAEISIVGTMTLSGNGENPGLDQVGIAFCSATDNSFTTVGWFGNSSYALVVETTVAEAGSQKVREAQVGVIVEDGMEAPGEPVGNSLDYVINLTFPTNFNDGVDGAGHLFAYTVGFDFDKDGTFEHKHSGVFDNWINDRVHFGFVVQKGATGSPVSLTNEFTYAIQNEHESVIPQPAIWLKASQGLGLVDERVAVWTNLALPGRFDAVQVFAEQRPGLLYEAWSGHPVVHFDGVNDILTLENTVSNSLFEGELTVFYVGRTTGGSFSGSGGFVGNFQTGTEYRNGWTLRAQSDGTYGFLVGNGSWNAVDGGTGLIGEDFVLLNTRYSDDGDGTGTMELFSSLLDEPSSVGTGSFSPDPSSVDISIGMFCGWNSLVFNQPAGCDVAEVRIYNVALSDEDRQTVWDELSAEYEVATEQAIQVVDFQPAGYEVSSDTVIQITFSESMNADSITNIIIGRGGLDGLPESNAWDRVAGRWPASVSNTVFTFTPDTTFAPGDLVMCEISTNVIAATGRAYETLARETYSFMIDNGVSYPVTTTLIDPMATVYHDNGDPHVLPLELCVPATEEPCPVMFWVHGGGWSGGDSGTWERSDVGTPAMGAYFSEKLGVAVAGVAWRSLANSEGTFSKAVTDIGLAIQYVIDHAEEYGIDTARMGLYGGSAGTPTSALVAQVNTNISCYIGFNGLYDFINRVPPYSFGGGTSFEQDVPSFEANSAAFNVRSKSPDTLLLHGDADTTIEYQQSLQYEAAVQAGGGNAEALIYRDEVHGFFNEGRPMYLPTLFAEAQHLRRVFGLDYGNWAQRYSLVGGPGDDDDCDGLNNLYEYGLDGDPTDISNLGTRPVLTMLRDNCFNYVHLMRNNDDSLLYRLEMTDDLVSGQWSTMSYTVSGTNDLRNGFSQVSNEVPVDIHTKFIRLSVE